MTGGLRPLSLVLGRWYQHVGRLCGEGDELVSSRAVEMFASLSSYSLSDMHAGYIDSRNLRLMPMLNTLCSIDVTANTARCTSDDPSIPTCPSQVSALPVEALPNRPPDLLFKKPTYIIPENPDA